MYGNVGAKYIQVKDLDIGDIHLRCTGQEFEIPDYYEFPHGYTTIKYKGIQLFIPDEIFEKHFVRKDEYDNYLNIGNTINVNVNGNLRTYEIDYIDTNGESSHYVALQLKAVD